MLTSGRTPSSLLPHHGVSTILAAVQWGVDLLGSTLGEDSFMATVTEQTSAIPRLLSANRTCLAANAAKLRATSKKVSATLRCHLKAGFNGVEYAIIS